MDLRRKFAIAFGCIQISLSLLFWMQSAYLSSSAANKFVYERENQLVDSMKRTGAVFSDEEVLRSLISEELREVPKAASKGVAMTSLVLGVNGLFLLVVGAWPSRKKQLGAPMRPKGPVGIEYVE